MSDLLVVILIHELLILSFPCVLLRREWLGGCFGAIQGNSGDSEGKNGKWLLHGT